MSLVPADGDRTGRDGRGTGDPPDSDRTAFARPVLGSALIAAAALAAYFPTLANGFVWDDDTTLLDNPLVKAGDGLVRIWTTGQAPDYWPVTYSSFWAEWHLWGRNALAYHADNLLLHILGCILLWSLLRRLAVPGALLAALLFAVHPVNVESVAWIAERKNLLAMVFYLLTIIFFLKTDEGGISPGSGRRPGTSLDYALSLLAFTLAMLSKGSVALAPVVLLGFILWHRKPNRADCFRLAPFFAVSAVFTAVNLAYKAHKTVEVVRDAGLPERLLGAGAAVWFYLGKALWPARLIFIYPLWKIDPGDWRWWVPLAAAIALTALLLRTARAALFAWLYFVVSLVPVLGFTDVYFMRYSLVADHYQHLALLGVVTAAGALWAGWRSDPRLKRAAAALVLAALGVLTWNRCLQFRDSETLYRGVLARNPDAWLAHNNLVNILRDTHRVPEAIGHLEEALRLRPQDILNENNLGVALLSVGRPAEAVPHLEKAVRADPQSLEFNFNLGLALAQAGRPGEAVDRFQAVVRLRPDFANGHLALAEVLWKVGRTDEAVAEHERGVQLQSAAR